MGNAKFVKKKTGEKSIKDSHSGNGRHIKYNMTKSGCREKISMEKTVLPFYVRLL